MGNSNAVLKKDDDDEEQSDDEDDYLDNELHSSWQPSNYGVSASDRRGLMKFYKAAGGDKWRTRSNWLKPSPLGVWYGITVGSRHGQKMVVEVSLHHNRLRGELNKSAIEFSKLMHLEVLNLGHNKLNGTIPAELCMVERLKELILNDNQLTGPVPEFLAKMPRLTVVDLASNELTGKLALSLPVHFARQQLIEVFDVNNNDLAGYVSEEWGRIRSLRELGLGGNRFTGDIPDELCNLSNLERLDLHENRLFSEIPESMASLTALKRLRLHGNTHIEGMLPEELMRIGRLDVLSMHFEVGGDMVDGPAQ
jgi:hypothetical protein